MRRAACVDKNQPEIVKMLRSHGISVEPLHTVGNGCPDLLCGFRDVNVLIEVKDPGESHNPAHNGLNKEQQDWHAKWAGQRAVVRTWQEAVTVVVTAATERRSA